MGKYLLAGLVVLFLALNVAAYVFIVVELDGSTIKSTKTVAPSPERESERPR